MTIISSGKRSLFALLALLALTATFSHADQKTALLVRPDDGQHPFWNSFAAAMNAACQDLGWKFENQNANWDQLKMVDQLNKRLSAEPKIDVVIFQSFKKNGVKIMQVLEANKVPGFLVNAGLDEQQMAEAGLPREKFTQWIGQMLPDDVGAGQAAMELLYQRAQAKGLLKNGKLPAFGIEGISADGASVARVAGMRRALETHPDIEMHQVVQGRWEFSQSQKAAQSLLERYADTSVIWAAGDSTALGAIKAVKDAGKTPGKDILSVGVDWVPEALDAIKAGELEGSAGGHFMEGAWAMIVLTDYFNGIDFANKEGVKLSSKMGLITSDNLSAFQEKFGSGDWSKIDFKKLSKSLNPACTEYNFDLTNLMR